MNSSTYMHCSPSLVLFAIKVISRKPGDLQRTEAGDLQRTEAGDLQSTEAGDLQRTETGDLQRTEAGDLQRTETDIPACLLSAGLLQRE